MSEHTKGRADTIATGRKQPPTEREALRAELAAARAQNEKLLAMVQEQDRMLGHKACATKECRELLAARALLSEVLEVVSQEEYGEPVRRAQDWLDACDTLGSGNG